MDQQIRIRSVSKRYRFAKLNKPLTKKKRCQRSSCIVPLTFPLHILYYLGQGIPVTFDDQRFFLAKENSKRRSPESPIPYSASGERDKIYVILPFPPFFLSELCRKYKNRCCHVIVYSATPAS